MLAGNAPAPNCYPFQHYVPSIHPWEWQVEPYELPWLKSKFESCSQAWKEVVCVWQPLLDEPPSAPRAAHDT